MTSTFPPAASILFPATEVNLCALTIRVAKQTCAYITVDGNNMVSGLREKILAALEELGVRVGEILTTDTHVVNAVVLTTRGYHPLGEAIPHEEIVNIIEQTAETALTKMKSGAAAWKSGTIVNVKVIGETQIRELPLLADKALRLAKKTAVPLFALTGLVLTALLVFL